VDSVETAIWAQFNIKRGDTLPFTPYRNMSGRIGLAELFGKLGYKTGAEIGVSKGWYSEVLCKSAPGLHLLCVDPWQAYGGWDDETMEGRLVATKDRLAGYDYEIIRKPSLEAVKDVPPNSLDFVYIDGLHEFDPVMQDIIQWVGKVRKGGIVSGHDYFHFRGAGVVAAVNAYVAGHHIDPWYVTREDAPSFFWVNRGT
jgi:hypothetical protein